MKPPVLFRPRVVLCYSVALLINWKLSELKLVFTYLRVLEHERQSNYTQALVHSSPSVHLRRKNEFSQRCLLLCEQAQDPRLILWIKGKSHFPD